MKIHLFILALVLMYNDKVTFFDDFYGQCRGRVIEIMPKYINQEDEYLVDAACSTSDFTESRIMNKKVSELHKVNKKGEN